jgi:hypothetical protein
MTVATQCPGCQRPLKPAAWLNARQAHCPDCDRDLEFVPFPALTAVRAVARPETATIGDDATCFFHAVNRAAAVCSSCGRLLCAVCAVDFAGRCLCPNCIAQRPAALPDTVKSRLLWDSIALALATLPLIAWPFTLATAPTAIGLALYGWNKPGSLVRGSRVRLVLALVLGGLQVAGWVFGLVMALQTPHRPH